MDICKQMKIHKALEYIRQDPEFAFDTHDDPEIILAHYGVCLDLSSEEKQELYFELKEIADEHQTAEIVRKMLAEL